MNARYESPGGRAASVLVSAWPHRANYRDFLSKPRFQLGKSGGFSVLPTSRWYCHCASTATAILCAAPLPREVRSFPWPRQRRRYGYVTSNSKP